MTTPIVSGLARSTEQEIIKAEKEKNKLNGNSLKKYFPKQATKSKRRGITHSSLNRVSMIRNFTLIILLTGFSLGSARAQVGVGTTTPNSTSILDLTSTTKGMLAPRMTDAQKNAISSPATGLLVYQTDGTNGFYYYDGTQWLPLISRVGWTITGNDGTVDGTNFIGTTDDVAFNIRVNNGVAGRIGNSTEGTTNFGYHSGNVNTYNGSTFFGYNAGAANTSGTSNASFGWNALQANTTGFNNSAMGYGSLKSNTTGFDNAASGMNALYANTTGGQNTAMGSNSLYSNTSGNGNSACGQNALYTNTTGVYNAAIGVNGLRLCTTGGRNVASGYNALSTLTTGSYNTGIGYTAGSTNTTGSNNTFVGSNADAASNNLSNATAIGYSASVGSSNCLVLGGSGVNLVKVGIGVSSPSNSLSFDGQAARTIWMERHTTSGNAGNNLTLQSGGAYSGGTNLNGGDLNLSAGTSTGTGYSNIYFKIAAAGSSGTADNSPATVMTVYGSTSSVGIGTTTPGTTLQVVGGITSTSATSGIGYATGAGGTVTQITSKSTGVTLNKNCGTITMNNAALASATIVSFTVTNSSVAANDVIITQHDSGGTIGAYTVTANTMAAGSFKITVRNNTAGSLSEAIVIRFAVIKATTN